MASKKPQELLTNSAEFCEFKNRSFLSSLRNLLVLGFFVPTIMLAVALEVHFTSVPHKTHYKYIKSNIKINYSMPKFFFLEENSLRSTIILTFGTFPRTVRFLVENCTMIGRCVGIFSVVPFVAFLSIVKKETSKIFT